MISVQTRREPRRYLLGASVDVTNGTIEPSGENAKALTWSLCVAQATMLATKPQTRRTTSLRKAVTAVRRRTQPRERSQRETGRPRIGRPSRNRWRSAPRAAAEA